MTSIDRRGVLRGAAGSAAAAALAAGCAAPTTASTASTAPTTSTASTASPAGGRPAGSGSAAPRPALPDQITHGPPDRAAVALTFHGQGDPELAERLMRTAERAGARLTVLAVGSWLEEQPGMARRILDGGHELGNHTHRHLDICAMAPDAASAEITRCADRLRALTGNAGRWFRPSRARWATPLVLRLAREAGYPHVLSYDLDPLDYTDPGADTVREAILGRVHAGSVVSLHLGHPGTVAAMPAVLDGLGRRGLRAVTASELLT